MQGKIRKEAGLAGRFCTFTLPHNIHPKGSEWKSSMWKARTEWRSIAFFSLKINAQLEGNACRHSSPPAPVCRMEARERREAPGLRFFPDMLLAHPGPASTHLTFISLLCLVERPFHAFMLLCLENFSQGLWCRLIFLSSQQSLLYSFIPSAQRQDYWIDIQGTQQFVWFNWVPSWTALIVFSFATT